MNAVNLIPEDARKRHASISASPATLALIGGLLAVLAAAVLYVSAENDVTARKSELAQVTASVTRWQATANSYTSLVQFAKERDQQLGAVRQLAATRFPWSLLLSQIGGLMPARSALSSLQATTPASTPTSTSAGASSSTSTASSAVPASTPLAPTVQLSGCAQSQSTVAQTMVQLHRISGVSAVILASSTDSAGSSGAAAGSSGQAGGCPFPVAFQVSLTFAAPSPVATATAGSTSGAPTPTASAVTTTTGTSR
jgi:hypothetical protein